MRRRIGFPRLLAGAKSVAEQSEGRNSETLSAWVAAAAKPVFAGVVLTLVASVTSAFLVSRDNASRISQFEHDLKELETELRTNKRILQKFMEPGDRFTSRDGSQLSARVDTNSLLIRELSSAHNAHLQRGERYIAEIERLKEDMRQCLVNCYENRRQYQLPNKP